MDPESPSFMKQCEEGSGYIVTRGRNVMKGYVGNEEATAKALAMVPEADVNEGPWYLNLGDVDFSCNPVDSNQDIFDDKGDCTPDSRGATTRTSKSTKSSLGSLSIASVLIRIA